jgi:hypothetical protein
LTNLQFVDILVLVIGLTFCQVNKQKEMLYMEKIIEKASRLQRPRHLAVQLRPDVYEWLYDVGRSIGGMPSPATIARALLEDAYDRFSGLASDEEVSSNAQED